MKVLVTGGCGFIGSHLTNRLVDEGHTVDVVDNLSGGDLANLTCKWRSVLHTKGPCTCWADAGGQR